MNQKITRQAQRYPIQLQLRELNGQPVDDAFLVDLSAQGARLESAFSMKPRSQVEFSFRLPDADSETRLAGVVLWVQPVVEQPDRYHLGVKFSSTFKFHDAGTMTRPDNGKGSEEKTRLISFLGSKGGVGNTFLTINVGYLLAQEKKGRVLVVDLDLLYGQSVYFLNARPKFTIIDVIEKFEHLDKSYVEGLLHNYNDYLSLLPAPARLEESEIITSVHIKELLNYLKSLHIFKWILLDCYHQIDEVTLTTIESSDDVFLVTDPSITALCNAKKQLELLNLLNLRKSKVSVILNSWKNQSFLGEAEVVKFLKQELGYKIGFDPIRVNRSIGEGHPLGVTAPRFAASLGLTAVADRLMGASDSRKRSRWGWIKNIVKRS